MFSEKVKTISIFYNRIGDVNIVYTHLVFNLLLELDEKINLLKSDWYKKTAKPMSIGISRISQNMITFYGRLSKNIYKRTTDNVVKEKILRGYIREDLRLQRTMNPELLIMINDREEIKRISWVVEKIYMPEYSRERYLFDYIDKLGDNKDDQRNQN